MSDIDHMRQTLDHVAKALGETHQVSSDAVSFNSVKHGDVTVDINPNVGGHPGANLKRKTPSIVIFINHKVALELTWDEARHFCKALTDVTDTAEYG